MADRWLRIGRAAEYLGLNVKTLLRAERRGLIHFTRNRLGWRYIRLSQLQYARVLTLGHLAKRLHLPYRTLLKAAYRYRLLVSRLRYRRSRRVGYRLTSLADGSRFKRWLAHQRGRWTGRPR